jgi:hypothetical protein
MKQCVEECHKYRCSTVNMLGFWGSEVKISAAKKSGLTEESARLASL